MKIHIMLSYYISLYYRIIFRLKKRKIEKIYDGNRVWFISDTHFGHRNILKFGRYDTFHSISQMDRTLIINWNRSVKPRDRIYFLGDFGRMRYRYRRKLHGNIKGIKGNHDRITWSKQRILQYNGLIFLLIHDPNDHTQWFFGDWIIHGHTHDKTPFIDIYRKRINVSCEVINYSPINFVEIYKQIQIAKLANGNVQFKLN